MEEFTAHQTQQRLRPCLVKPCSVFFSSGVRVTYNRSSASGHGERDGGSYYYVFGILRISYSDFIIADSASVIVLTYMYNNSAS